MLTARSLRRLCVILLIALFFTIAACVAAWTFAASQFRKSIDSWIESGRASGYTINFDDRTTFGFPRHVVLRFVNLNWRNPEGITFHADNMDVSSLPWNTEAFDARFRGHAEITAPLEAAQTLTLGGNDGRAHVVLDQGGYWKFTHISMTDARIGRLPDLLIQADKLDATAMRPEKLPKDHSEPGLTLTGTAENVTLPENIPQPFGTKMAELGMTLRVMGAVPDFRRKDSVAAWNDESGIVEFDDLSMKWGPLHMTAKGTIGFDDDLQPEGAFSSKITNHRDVLKALMDHKFIADRQAKMLNSALDVLAKPSGERPDIEVPITIQLNGLFLGPVRIFMFPGINWQASASVDGSTASAVGAAAPSSTADGASLVQGQATLNGRAGDTPQPTSQSTTPSTQQPASTSAPAKADALVPAPSAAEPIPGNVPETSSPQVPSSKR